LALFVGLGPVRGFRLFGQAHETALAQGLADAEAEQASSHGDGTCAQG